MRKNIAILVGLFCCLNNNAQYRFTGSLSTTTTNYFLQLPLFALEEMLNVGDIDKSQHDDKYLFLPQLILPFSIGNQSPNDFGQMKGGYARSFSAPWNYLGDYSINIVGAWDHYDNPFGFYLGLGYKSKEVVFGDSDLNDRAHYISPKAGVRFKFGSQKGLFFEAGSSYDYAFQYKGRMHDYDKDAIKSGFNLNFGIGRWNANGHFQFNIEIPLYNFYNNNFSTDNNTQYPFKDTNRKMGYLSLIWRFVLSSDSY